MQGEREPLLSLAHTTYSSAATKNTRHPAATKRDPLLASGGRRIAAVTWLKEQDTEGGPHDVAVRTVTLTTISCVAFSITLGAVAEEYHHWPLATIIFVSLVFGVGVVLSVVLSKERWHPWLGRHICAASLLGVIAGLYIYFGQLVYYYHYNLARVESNAAPSQGPVFFGDAGLLGFTSDTMLDTARSIGYQYPETGDVLCVAPIVDSMTTLSSPVSLFAVGVDCCNWRSNFHCGDADDPQARSGVMYLEPEQLVGPLMAWSVQDDRIEGFKKATKLQASVYDMVVSDSPRFVRWTRDPRAEVDAYRRRAVGQAAVACALVFAVSFAAAFFVAVGPRRLRQFLDRHTHEGPHPGVRFSGGDPGASPPLDA